MSQNSVFNCLKFSSVVCFLLIFQLASGQSKKQPKEIGLDNFAELDGLVQRNEKTVGKNLVAMVWTDTVVYKREAGEMDMRTVVPLGAASQWLTAALVMKFVEEGKISLDDKVVQYIPIYETYAKSYITIGNCLNHFAGIATDAKMFSKKKYESLEEVAEALAKREIQTNPGTEFRYSSNGYHIVARILEIVGKKKFDMLMKQKVLNPLGMRKTTFSTLDGSAIDPFDGGQGTAEDYMHFLKMLLNNGNYNGQQVLSQESIKELKKIQTRPEAIKYAPKQAEGLSYSTGSWVVEENAGGDGTALSSITGNGSWSMVDWCRGYAFLLLPKTSQGDQKREMYLEMKAAVDDRVKSKCK